MTLFTGCIYDFDNSRGVRVSVMSRHTLDDGVTPDSRIDERSYDEHLVDLAPDPGAVGKWYRGEINWEKFCELYKEKLRKDEISSHVRRLADRAVSEDLTILCKEKDASCCHRSVLAEECRQYQPELEIVHL